MNDGADDFVGKVVLGRYRIVRVLAKGGMGVIYLARSEGAAGFVKPVVVKRILADLVAEDAMVKMFKREARIMSNLRHPGIVSVIDFGQERNSYFMVLDYIHGFHLGRWYRFVRATRGSFPAELAIHIVINVLDALHYAHTLVDADGKPQNIVHRDVTPSNVLIDVDGGHIKLADFGIARMRTDHTEFKTSETTIKGKFPYIPPELFRGGEPGPSSDVYAAGVVLHELLTGKNEFRMKDVSSTIARVLQHVPSSVETNRQDAPPGLDTVLGKALAKSPAERYASAADFAQGLRAIRQLTADQATKQLAEMANRDFHDPAMAKLFGAPPLASLERAWREEPSSSISIENRDASGRPDTTSGVALETTHHEVGPLASAATPAPAGSSNWKWIALVVAMLLLAGAAVVGVVLMYGPREGADSPVVVYKTGVGDDGVGEPRSFPEVTRDPGTETTSDSTTEIPTHTAVKGSHNVRGVSRGDDKARGSSQRGADAFSRVFSRQSAKIAACFESHAEDIVGTPQIWIRFHVDTKGSVSEAELDPAPLRSTPLGACVIGVAKQTTFEPQEKPVRVRIPITTRRGN